MNNIRKIPKLNLHKRRGKERKAVEHILLEFSSVFPAFAYFPRDNSTYRGYKLRRHRGNTPGNKTSLQQPKTGQITPTFYFYRNTDRATVKKNFFYYYFCYKLFLKASSSKKIN